MVSSHLTGAFGCYQYINSKEHNSATSFHYADLHPKYPCVQMVWRFGLVLISLFFKFFSNIA